MHDPIPLHDVMYQGLNGLIIAGSSAFYPQWTRTFWQSRIAVSPAAPV